MVLLAVAAASVHPRPAGAARPRTTVVAYGDSEMFQAWPYLLGAFDLRSTDLHVQAISGTALCDFLPTIEALTAAHAPNVVVLQFYGNTYTSCIAPYRSTPATVAAKYGADLATALGHLEAIKVPHVLVDVGPKLAHASALHDLLVTTFKLAVAAARRPGYLYLDAADGAVELPGGAYARLLPCLRVEVANAECVGPVAFGVRTNVVRSRDGFHFCPTAVVKSAGRIEVCGSYSSGAYRYAMAFARAIWRAAPATSVAATSVPVVNGVARTGRTVGSMTEVLVTGHALAAVRAAHFCLVRELSPLAYRISVLDGTIERVVSPHSLLALVPTSAASFRGNDTEGFVTVLTPTAQSVFLGLSQAALPPR